MESLVLKSVLIPVLGPFLFPILNKISKDLRNIGAVLIIAMTFILNVYLMNSSFGNEAKYVIAFPLGFDLILKLDPLSAFMATVTSLTSLVIVIYSIDYISHYPNQTEYYTMLVLFIGSMIGLVYSDNLMWMYIFWEITGFTSWRLVGFFRNDKDVLKANKTILVTVFGAIIMLVGILMIYIKEGTINMSDLRSKEIAMLPAFLIIAGIFSKSAILPFSTWLPDAGVAPSTVTALLHAAVLVKIGTFAYAKIFGTTFITPVEFNYTVLIITGITALVSGGAALIENDIKRIIAYSTISQLSFIFLGLASGTKMAFAGGLLYILMHSIAKASLFLCAGIIEQKTHTKDITKMGGLIKTMPLTALAFALSSFSVMGLPPFGGFFAKFIVFKGAVETNDILIITMFFIGSILTILYLSRLFYKVFLGNEKLDTPTEGSTTMVVSVLFLGLLGLFLGILVNYPLGFTEMVSQIMYTGVK
jgi:NADH:ubiquinone oxidoreductase subunit 5 (subunit L)/multisubunit Na+/H+ antiporter MnhA subunit